MSPQKKGNRPLALNVLWNLGGAIAPSLVAVFAIPKLIEGLGTSRFGLLTISWALIGYFNLFDIGLGRALTKIVAEKLGKQQHEEIPTVITTAIILMTVLGIIGALVAGVLSPWLVHRVLNIPPELHIEALTSFYLLAASIPLVVTTTGLRGVLEAHQHFDYINIIRIPLGMLSFLAPLAVLPFSNSLVYVVIILLITRIFSWFAYAFLCLRVVPDIRNSFSISPAIIKPLINFGGWMTLTNFIGPLMVYLDRFLIGIVISMSAVAYYTTPYEIVTKLWIIPIALMGVLFPAFSSALAGNKTEAARLFAQAVKFVFISLFPIVLIIVVFAHDGMTIWLGKEFADNSTWVLQLLTIGVFINSHAQIPFGILQSAGRPDITAKLHLIELPIYLCCLWWFLNMYGILGAAAAWVIRVSIDTFLLFFLSYKLVPASFSLSLRPIVIAAAALGIMFTGSLITGILAKGIFSVIVLLVFILTVWFEILSKMEKNMIFNYIKKIPLFSTTS